MRMIGHKKYHTMKRMEKKKKAIVITPIHKLRAVFGLSVMAATIFWISALIYETLGTDYLFDAVILPLSEGLVGTWILLILTAFLPLAGSGYAFVVWRNQKIREGLWMTLTGAALGIMGVGMALIKF